MHVIARSRLREFWEEHTDSEQPLKAWFAEAKKATWRNPNQIKALYGSASILREQRVVFNIAGDKYRLVVRISYRAQIAFIRFIGTHEEYDAINAEEV